MGLLCWKKKRQGDCLLLASVEVGFHTVDLTLDETVTQEEKAFGVTSSY